ncbi:hypothetical protein RO07_12465 [Pandoraea pulmonicola]|nr:hypothetical protein RO07_12465 [Pandoraea pulmonicola]
MSVGGVFDANAQPVKAPELAPNVNIGTVKKPSNVQVKTPKTWKRVVIELTPEQKAQLAKAGVQTDQLKITTYNIERLAGDMVN